jgi:hypothetical protein
MTLVFLPGPRCCKWGVEIDHVQDSLWWTSTFDEGQQGMNSCSVWCSMKIYAWRQTWFGQCQGLWFWKFPFLRVFWKISYLVSDYQ